MLDFCYRVFFYHLLTYGNIRKGRFSVCWEKGELAEEAFGWLFVNNVPLLYDKKKVARQFQVETWLDLAQVVKELGIEKLEENRPTANTAGYIV